MRLDLSVEYLISLEEQAQDHLCRDPEANVIQ